MTVIRPEATIFAAFTINPCPWSKPSPSANEAPPPGMTNPASLACAGAIPPLAKRSCHGTSQPLTRPFLFLLASRSPISAMAKASACESMTAVPSSPVASSTSPPAPPLNSASKTTDSLRSKSKSSPSETAATSAKPSADSASGPFRTSAKKRLRLLLTLCPNKLNSPQPANFTREEDEGYSFVYKQPENDEEIEQCKEAMEGCPVEAIGDDGE